MDWYLSTLNEKIEQVFIQKFKRTLDCEKECLTQENAVRLKISNLNVSKEPVLFSQGRRVYLLPSVQDRYDQELTDFKQETLNKLVNIITS